jgi:hypothetical protein
MSSSLSLSSNPRAPRILILIPADINKIFTSKGISQKIKASFFGGPLSNFFLKKSFLLFYKEWGEDGECRESTLPFGF